MWGSRYPHFAILGFPGISRTVEVVTAGVSSVYPASNTGEISTQLLEHSDLLLQQLASKIRHVTRSPRHSVQLKQSALPRQSALFIRGNVVYIGNNSLANRP